MTAPMYTLLAGTSPANRTKMATIAAYRTKAGITVLHAWSLRPDLEEKLTNGFTENSSRTKDNFKFPFGHGTPVIITLIVNIDSPKTFKVDMYRASNGELTWEAGNEDGYLPPILNGSNEEAVKILKVFLSYRGTFMLSAPKEVTMRSKVRISQADLRPRRNVKDRIPGDIADIRVDLLGATARINSTRRSEINERSFRAIGKNSVVYGGAWSRACKI